MRLSSSPAICEKKRSSSSASWPADVGAKAAGPGAEEEAEEEAAEEEGEEVEGVEEEGARRCMFCSRPRVVEVAAARGAAPLLGGDGLGRVEDEGSVIRGLFEGACNDDVEGKGDGRRFVVDWGPSREDEDEEDGAACRPRGGGWCGGGGAVAGAAGVAAIGGTFWKLVLQRPLLGMLDIDFVVLRPRLKEPRLSMIELDGPPPCIFPLLIDLCYGHKIFVSWKFLASKLVAHHILWEGSFVLAGAAEERTASTHWRNSSLPRLL
jgi:hypothetical protein